MQAIVSAAAFAGSWDMKGGEADALTSLEKTLLKKKLAVPVFNGLGMGEDVLAFT